MPLTHDRDRAEEAAYRLHKYLRAANIRGTGSVEEVEGGAMRLRATLYNPEPEDVEVVRRVPMVDGIDVRIVIEGR